MALLFCQSRRNRVCDRAGVAHCPSVSKSPRPAPWLREFAPNLISHLPVAKPPTPPSLHTLALKKQVGSIFVKSSAENTAGIQLHTSAF